MVSGKVLVRNPARKRSIDRPGGKWKGSFKMGLKKYDGRIGFIWIEKWTTDRGLQTEL